jgi:molybdate transport system substrate-binding protein
MCSVKYLAGLYLLLASIVIQASQSPVRVAVASSFYKPMKIVANAFSVETGINVTLHPGATGGLYHQIIQGAPFHIFLSADTLRPSLLYKKGLSDTPRTYAQGVLALWSPSKIIKQVDDLQNFSGRLAIADSRLAPYGLAAEQVLTHFEANNLQLIKGLSVAQVQEYVHRQVVPVGLLSAGQLVGKTYTVVPQNLYDPIVQQGVLLTKAKNNIAVKQLWDFIFSPKAQKIIKQQGFNIIAMTPDVNNGDCVKEVKC